MIELPVIRVTQGIAIADQFTWTGKAPVSGVARYYADGCMIAEAVCVIAGSVISHTVADTSCFAALQKAGFFVTMASEIEVVTADETELFQRPVAVARRYEVTQCSV